MKHLDLDANGMCRRCYRPAGEDDILPEFCSGETNEDKLRRELDGARKQLVEKDAIIAELREILEFYKKLGHSSDGGLRASAALEKWSGK